ncbi:MAG: hypothetical protein L0210_03995 [Rhodospirillales bacterium]|nr:hypothetical protein [Rhodospirillales bacterium]
MRWKEVFVVGAVILPLAACDDKTSDDTTTQKATPDNTPELTCRMIKECNDELQRRAQAKQDQFWDADPNKKIDPAQIDTTNDTQGSGQDEQPQQADKPTQ